MKFVFFGSSYSTQNSKSHFAKNKPVVKFSDQLLKNFDCFLKAEKKIKKKLSIKTFTSTFDMYIQYIVKTAVV